MFSQFFGQYLLDNQKITTEQFSSCMKYIKDNRVKLGLIAENEGLLTRNQANELNYLQMQTDKRFGQNYARLSDMESSVEALSDQKETREAQEDVIKETISKKASELTQTTTTEENPYLAQGYYIVEQGDKLTDISKKVYGNDTMVQAICEKNNIEDIDLIKAGDKLLLP